MVYIFPLKIKYACGTNRRFNSPGLEFQPLKVKELFLSHERAYNGQQPWLLSCI